MPVHRGRAPLGVSGRHPELTKGATKRISRGPFDMASRTPAPRAFLLGAGFPICPVPPNPYLDASASRNAYAPPGVTR